jgi:hypothetical protein
VEEEEAMIAAKSQKKKKFTVQRMEKKEIGERLFVSKLFFPFS